MTLEASTIIGLGFTTISGIGIYLFTRSSDHEKRIQRIEDVQGSQVKELKDELHELSTKVQELTDKVNIMAANIHNQKNTDNVLNMTLSQILKYLENENK